MLSTPQITLNESEVLLWTILYQFEALALMQYQSYAPALVTPEKQKLVAFLSSRISDNTALLNTDLNHPVQSLLDSATSDNETHTLIIQGLLLEALGKTIYQHIKDNDSFAGNSQELSTIGLQSEDVSRPTIQKLISEKIGTGDDLHQVFINVSKPVVTRLDSLGESLDQHFSERFGISFSDLMGDFVAELITLCTELGIERRKLVSYLTSTLMGI